MSEDTEYKGPESNWFMRHPSVAVSLLAGCIIVANWGAGQWHAEQLAPELEKVHKSIGKLHHRDWVMSEYLITRDREQTAIIRAIAESTGVPVDEPSRDLELSIARVQGIYADGVVSGG